MKVKSLNFRKKKNLKPVEEYLVQDKVRGFRGRQKIYKFENNFGASCIDGPMLHSFKFFSEIAVFDFRKEEGHRLTYETDITEDVEITGSYEEEQELLRYIQMLDENGKLTKKHFKAYMNFRYPQ